MWKTFDSEKILDAVFPQFCLGCNQEGFLVCPDCLSTIDLFDFQYCPFCQKPQRVINRGKCPTHQKMSLDGLLSAVSYKNLLVKTMIKKFKYEPFIRNLKLPLAYLIIAHFFSSQNNLLIDNQANSFFLAVPLSRKKEKWRGFNQSTEIAAILSEYFTIPLLKNNLIKIKNTPAQADLKKEERQKNIKGVFQLKNPEQVRNKIIFLVDDVFTSGATLEECAFILKEAGAKKVWGITIARELFD